MIEEKESGVTENEEMSRKDRIKDLLSWVLTIAVAVLLALFLNNVVIINARIPSGSMENTIMTGDRVIGLRFAYNHSEPQRGDIIIFRFPDDETQKYVKRVIGLPGETVTIQDAKVYIDGEELQEDYLKEEWTVATGPFTFEVSEDSYLVMGDNRNNSWDARYWTNTYVTKDKILGQARFRYWPLTEMGKVE